MKRKGFTLIELLVVIAIIALLMGILMPALNHARQLAERLVCGAQLKGIGNAMAVYAVDNKDDFPQAGPPGVRWATAGFVSFFFESTPERIYSGGATVTSSLYLLVKYASCTPGQFVCKGDGAKEFKVPKKGPPFVQAMSLEDFWDFGGQSSFSERLPGQSVSYAYNMPYLYTAPVAGAKATSFVINDAFNPGAAVAADRNPHLDNRAALPGVRANSIAHQGKGQSVLYKDGSREWREDVTVGIGGDNIYTHGGSERDGFGVRDGAAPADNGDGGPHGMPDSYLVSEKNF